MSRNKPPLAIRFAILAVAWGFARLEHNPVVRMEAYLGLSPSPLERLFGIRGMFSGMTEATHRLASLDAAGALQANVLVFPVLFAIAAAISSWRVPKLIIRRREAIFFGVVIGGTAINNLAPELLG